MYNPNIIIGAAVIAVIAGGAYYYYNKSSKKETVEVAEAKAEEVVVDETPVEVEEKSVEEHVKCWKEELRAEGYDEETMSRIIDIKLGTLRHHYKVKTERHAESEKTKRHAEEEKAKREEEKAKREEEKAKRERDEFVSAVGGAAVFCLVAANIAIELPVVVAAAGGAAVGYAVYNMFKD